MSLERINPGSLIEITDPILNGRKVAIVDDTGLGYYDLIGPDELPKPIHSEMEPVQLGPMQSWMKALPAELEPDFIAAWDGLLSRGLDVLAVARGLAYAMKTHDFSLDKLERTAQEEADRIRQARSVLEQALRE